MVQLGYGSFPILLVLFFVSLLVKFGCLLYAAKVNTFCVICMLQR